MTDGAWKFAGWNPVWEYALETSDPEAMIEGIRCAALQRGGSLQDDFTLLVVQEDGKPQP